MGIEYENIGAVISMDVTQYLLRNELCTSEEALALCAVYEGMPPQIQDLSWFEVLGFAMKQDRYLYSFWEMRRKAFADRPPNPDRIVPGLISTDEGFRPLEDPNTWVNTLKSLTGARNDNG